MNIVKAVNSGRPFKRENDAGWLVSGPEGYIYDEHVIKHQYLNEDYRLCLSAQDITAGDWETKPEELKVTEDILMDAFYTAYHSAPNVDETFKNFMSFLNELNNKIEE